MNQTSLAPFDSTLQTTNVWLHEVLEQLGWHERHRAYHALKAVLHALRDQLSVDQAVALAAQFPMLVRGFYYEGWKPHEKPFKERNKETFVATIAAANQEERHVDPTRLARAVFHVLSKHVSPGEIESVKHDLPTDLRSLWP